MEITIVHRMFMIYGLYGIALICIMARLVSLLHFMRIFAYTKTMHNKSYYNIIIWYHYLETL